MKKMQREINTEMEIDEVVKIYSEVVSEYNKGIHTQKEIADNMQIPLEAVRKCTKRLGYWHTKAAKGKSAVISMNDSIFSELQKILSKEK